MKRSALFAFVLICAATQAQKLKGSEVPAAVKAAFTKNFPNVKKVEWSKESEGEFEAEFKNGKMEQSSNFDAAGKWLATETEINKSELPAAVQASIKNEFDGYELEEAEKVETSDKGTYYEVKVEKGEKSYSVEIASDGKVIRKEEEKEKEGKDN